MSVESILCSPRSLSSSSMNSEKVTVILVDSQGMFDHETTMVLTDFIFGLTMFLISYQIYNIDKRIHEDNLIQFALFSEYGWMIVRNDTKDNNGQYQPRLCGV